MIPEGRGTLSEQGKVCHWVCVTLELVLSPLQQAESWVGGCGRGAWALEVQV